MMSHSLRFQNIHDIYSPPIQDLTQLPFSLHKETTLPRLSITVAEVVGLRYQLAWAALDDSGVTGYDLDTWNPLTAQWDSLLQGSPLTQAELVGNPSGVTKVRVTAYDSEGQATPLETRITVAPVTKRYTLGTQPVALSRGEQAYYTFTDGLDSTLALARVTDGQPVAQLRSTPAGAPLWSSGPQLSPWTFTGQRSSDFGLLDYHARFYDPSLNRWLQPDTMIPDPYNPLDWDRYAYVHNNPVNHTDPTGHDTCDEEGNCYDNQGWHRAPNTPRLSIADTWKMLTYSKYGINISDGGDKSWDNTNSALMFSSLASLNNALNGQLRSMTWGATFTLMNHVGDSGEYNGATHTARGEPTGIDFYTKGTQPLRHQNIFHEFGHLLDNVPGTWDVFTNAVSSLENPSWVLDNKINREALKSLYISTDPNYPSVEARQTYSNFGPSELWAAAFANYVAGNIDLSMPNGPGRAMYNFVSDALIP